MTKVYGGYIDEGSNEESMYDGAYYEEEVIGATQVPQRSSLELSATFHIAAT